MFAAVVWLLVMHVNAKDVRLVPRMEPQNLRYTILGIAW
jgi:hypothetical protein